MPTRRPTPPPPPADPLADLREPAHDQPGLPPGVTVQDPPMLEPCQEGVLESSAVFDQAWHDDAIRAVVARWHADLTAERKLHRGGSCPCAYLARTALLEAVGVALAPAVEGEGERDA